MQLQAQSALQNIRVVGIVERGFPRDASRLVQRQNGLIHAHHAIARARRDGVVDLVTLVLANQTVDGRCHVHDLKRGHKPARSARQQLLGNDRLQYRAQLSAYLSLLFRRPRRSFRSRPPSPPWKPSSSAE